MNTSVVVQLWAVLAGLALIGCQGVSSRVDRPEQYDLTAVEKSVLGNLHGVERVVELSDGSLVFTERYEYRMGVISSAANGVRWVGRHGGGPGEFHDEPRPILRLRGDTVAVWEGHSRRLSIFNHEMFERLEHAAGHLAEGLVWVAAAVNSDSTGRLYVSFPYHFGQASGAPDTCPVLRTSLTRWRLDTAWLQPIPPRFSHHIGGSADAGVIDGQILGPRNFFGVSRDGRMWSVLADEQRIVVGSSIREAHRGPPWDLKPRPVTQHDRDSVYDRWKSHPAYGRAEWKFADERSVITDAIISPYGGAWLRLDRTARRGATTYRVFDGEGVARYQVLFPAGTTIVGFGVEAIYTIREDEDGLETLYGVPRIEGMPAPGELPPRAAAAGGGSTPRRGTLPPGS